MLIACLIVKRSEYKRYSGGYSTRVPPLPIPNREVKPCHADGTEFVGELVAAVFYEAFDMEIYRRLFKPKLSSVKCGKVEILKQ